MHTHTANAHTHTMNTHTHTHTHVHPLLEYVTTEELSKCDVKKKVF